MNQERMTQLEEEYEQKMFKEHLNKTQRKENKQ